MFSDNAIDFCPADVSFCVGQVNSGSMMGEPAAKFASTCCFCFACSACKRALIHGECYCKSSSTHVENGEFPMAYPNLNATFRHPNIQRYSNMLQAILKYDIKIRWFCIARTENKAPV